MVQMAMFLQNKRTVILSGIAFTKGNINKKASKPNIPACTHLSTYHLWYQLSTLGNPLPGRAIKINTIINQMIPGTNFVNGTPFKVKLYCYPTKAE